MKINFILILSILFNLIHTKPSKDDFNKKFIELASKGNPTVVSIISETVREKNFTRDIVDTQKCLIPFNYYFEWKKENDKNQKYKFYFKERPIAYFLGVFQKLNNNIFFSILTRQASKSGQKIHIRCPQIIAIKSQVKNWFRGEGDWLKESYNNINNEDLFELGLKYEKN